PAWAGAGRGLWADAHLLRPRARRRRLRPVRRLPAAAQGLCRGRRGGPGALCGDNEAMITISDEDMRRMLAGSRGYCVVVLRHGPKYHEPGPDKIIWEHVRRNFAMRAAGDLAIVCPIRDDSELSGIGIFPGSLEAVRQLMDDDPGVKAGTFIYEIHATRSFPG